MYRGATSVGIIQRSAPSSACTRCRYVTSTTVSSSGSRLPTLRGEDVRALLFEQRGAVTRRHGRVVRRERLFAFLHLADDRPPVAGHREAREHRVGGQRERVHGLDGTALLVAVSLAHPHRGVTSEHLADHFDPAQRNRSPLTGCQT